MYVAKYCVGTVIIFKKQAIMSIDYVFDMLCLFCVAHSKGYMSQALEAVHFKDLKIFYNWGEYRVMETGTVKLYS